MSSPAATSLRRTLLRRLAAPLSLLALMSGLIAYWLAWQYTQHVVDRSLADLATAISRQIQIAGADAPQTVPPLAQAMFSDPEEHLVYRISNGDKVERIAPVALNPSDFVEEWLAQNRADAERLLDPQADRTARERARSAPASDFVLGDFDGPARRCRTEPSAWQVGFALNIGEKSGPIRYFKVRWTPPYRFALIAISDRAFAGCTEAVDMPDNLGTLFPAQGTLSWNYSTN